MSGFEDGFWWSNDGLRLHYRRYGEDAGAGRPGNRPPLICLPGLTRNARDFHELAMRLADRWTVITVDLRGRGDSAYARDPMSYVPITYVQDMEALLRELRITRFVGIGTSLGGIITMLLASTRPGRVVGALLNDVGPELSPDGLARIRQYVGQGRSYPTWVHAARALAEVQGPIFPDFQLSDWLAMAKNCMQLSPGGRIAYDYDMKIAEPFSVPGGEAGVDLWRAFGALKPVPVAITRGELSDLLMPETAARMVETLEDAELVTVPRVGHAPMLTEPEATGAIDRLLARVEARLAALAEAQEAAS